MSTLYAGLDVHSKWTWYVVQRFDGETLGRGRIPTSQEGLLRMKLDHLLPAGTRIGLETGTMAFFVARLLQQLDLEPVVIDAAEVRLKAYRPRQKSDRRDAFEICEGLRRDIYRAIVHVPPEPTVKLRQTLSQRRHFVRAKTIQVQAAKHLLRVAGFGHKPGRCSGSRLGNTCWSRFPSLVCECFWRAIMRFGDLQGSRSRHWRNR